MRFILRIACPGCNTGAGNSLYSKAPGRLHINAFITARYFYFFKLLFAQQKSGAKQVL
jgi:hypothetical protein